MSAVAAVSTASYFRVRFPRTCGEGLVFRAGLKGGLSRVLRYPDGAERVGGRSPRTSR
ncbi:MAG TPA: hypothetical protein VGK79_14895 [Gaiellaceae bacterium]|jgi:hypothetical protein